MGNLARKIIDAIQHTLLDQLLVRLIHFGWIVSLWGTHNGGGWVTGLSLLFMLVSFAGAWALGALANRRPKPHQRPGTFDRLHKSEPNGFSAWSELPAGGLRPPRIMRWIVAVLSAGARFPVIDLINLGLGLLGFGLVAALAYKPAEFWGGLHPDLAEASARNVLWLASAAAVLLSILRLWATDQRARLEPGLPMHPPAGWVGYIASAMLLLGFGAVAVMMGVPRWMVIAIALVLGVISLVRRWRERMLDLTFGKRAEELLPPTVGPPQP